ncbi:hypothetical protein L195_g063958, partial [Trifolium pratense]
MNWNVNNTRYLADDSRDHPQCCNALCSFLQDHDGARLDSSYAADRERNEFWNERS